MTKSQVEMAVAGVVGGGVGVLLGAGPLNFRLVDLPWVSPGLAAGVAVIALLAAFGLAALEHGLAAVLATVAGVALLVLLATSLLVGLLAGPLAALAVAAARAFLGRPKPGDPLDESIRLNTAAERAGQVRDGLRWCASEQAVWSFEAADRGDAKASWMHFDAYAELRDAADEVEAERTQMVVRRDLLAARALPEVVRVELVPRGGAR